MQCSSKSGRGARVPRRSRPRPHVELLESRLQPGSVVTGQGMGWSLLGDSLSFLDQGPLAPESLLSESHKPTQPSDINVFDIHTAALPVASASVAAVRTDTARHEGTAPAAGLTKGSPAWLNDELALLVAGGRTNAAPAANVTDGTPVSQPRVGAPASLQNANGAATSGNQISPAPVAVAPPQLVQLGSPIVVAPPLRSVPNVHLTTTHVDGIQIQASQPVWASYVHPNNGGSGDNRVLGVALDPSPGAAQPIVVTGFTQNVTDPTEFDGMAARFSADGKSATVATLALGPGTRTEGHSVDVDSAGNVYVTGQTDAGGTTTDLIVRVNPTLTNVDWMVSFTPTTSAVGNGLKLDAAGTNLYVTGGFDGNLFAAELTNLDAAMPTTVYGSVFNIAGAGNAVAPDSVGQADLAFTQISGADNWAGVGQVAADGMSAVAGHYTSVGPKGGMNGVTVDDGDSFYLTGAVGDATSPFSQLLVVKFDFNVTQKYAWGWELQDPNPPHMRVEDFIGRDIKVDSSGDAFMATTVDDGSGGNMVLFEVGPAGNTNLDFQGKAFGALDDQNRGLALDTANNRLYMAGFTNSTDFNFTTGEFQPNYGGGLYDGVLIADSLS